MARVVKSCIPTAARCATAVFVLLGVTACNAPGPQVPAASGVAATPDTCTDVINAAALKAVGQTHPLGQIWSFRKSRQFRARRLAGPGQRVQRRTIQRQRQGRPQVQRAFRGAVRYREPLEWVKSGLLMRSTRPPCGGGIRLARWDGCRFMAIPPARPALPMGRR